MKISSIKQRSLFIFFSATLLVNFCQAEIQKISSMQEVKKKFESIHPDHTLGIFDLDLVITIPKNPALQEKNLRLYSKIYQQIMDSMTPIEKDYAGNMKNTLSGSDLVEKETASIINEIQKKGIKLIGLTATMCGRLGHIQSLERKRSKELRKFGIDFSPSFKELDSTVFSNLNPFNNCYPAFRYGILFSNGEQSKNTKGQLLTEFFKKANAKYRTVVFIDDKRSNLESVENALKNYDPSIQFLGLEYTGAEKFVSPKVDALTFLIIWEYLQKKSKELCVNQEKNLRAQR